MWKKITGKTGKRCMEISFAFDKDSVFQKRLDGIYSQVNDLTIPLTLIAQSWYRSNRSIFAISGPGKYKDLSPKYKKEKNRKWGFVYPILFASGRLAGSITEPNNPEAINFIKDQKSLILGTRVPYGIYHQSDQPRTKMPYRPFLLVGVEQINQDPNPRAEIFIKILDNYLAQILAKRNQE